MRANTRDSGGSTCSAASEPGVISSHCSLSHTWLVGARGAPTHAGASSVVMGVPVTVPGHSATRSGCAASRTSTEDASAVCVSGVRSYCFVCFVLRVYSKVHHGMAQDARSRSVCAQIANRQRRVQCVASGSMKRRLQLHLSLRSPNFAQPLLYVKLLQDHVAHHDDADAADRRRPRNAALRRGLRQSQVAAMLWRGRGGLLGARRRRPTAALRRRLRQP
jgi:hypothetical protein